MVLSLSVELELAVRVLERSSAVRRITQEFRTPCDSSFGALTERREERGNILLGKIHH